MTAIAIWLNDENPKFHSLWVAADSRISGDYNSPLINDAVKLFELPVICRVPGKDGFFSKVDHFHSYGYCFAGSTLLGQNTFLALAPLLRNLAAAQPYTPSLIDIADFVHRYLSRVFDNYKVIACEKSAVEVALFGWCHATHKHYIFHYYPGEDEEGNYIMKCEGHTNLKSKSFVYLGDYRSDMIQNLKEAFDGHNIPGRPISRIPRHIIEDHIRNSEYKTIGGDIQLGIANVTGFKPLTIMKPRIGEEPKAYISYLGHELYEDIQNVGNAFVSMTGMV